MQDWKWYAFTGQFTTIILTTIVILAISILYNTKIRNHDDDQELSGFLIMMDSFINAIQELVVSMMGVRYRKLTPYAMYIILYIFIGGTFSVLGFDSPSTSYTVTFCMGLVTFMMIYYFGFKYQKWSYLKQYLNPLELITQFTPLISISFRLFGNLLGGTIIMGLVYSLLIGAQASFSPDATSETVKRIFETHQELDGYSPTEQYAYFWAGFNIFTVFITPFLHMYFDLFETGVQALVFMMLTFSYWGQAMGEISVSPGPTSRETKQVLTRVTKGRKKDENKLRK